MDGSVIDVCRRRLSCRPTPVAVSAQNMERVKKRSLTPLRVRLLVF